MRVSWRSVVKIWIAPLIAKQKHKHNIQIRNKTFILSINIYLSSPSSLSISKRRTRKKNYTVSRWPMPDTVHNARNVAQDPGENGERKNAAFFCPFLCPFFCIPFIFVSRLVLGLFVPLSVGFTAKI